LSHSQQMSSRLQAAVVAVEMEAMQAAVVEPVVY
jgi:hypothetical protein